MWCMRLRCVTCGGVTLVRDVSTWLKPLCKNMKWTSVRELPGPNNISLELSRTAAFDLRGRLFPT